MIINGKSIADAILDRLTKDVSTLRLSGINPTLAVILVGDDPASLAYIKQKQKAAEKIGASVRFDHQPATINPDVLKRLIATYNDDPGIHGLIVQRPIPREVGDVSDILQTVALPKDVDGFLPDSPFDVPVAAAVGEILRWVHSNAKGNTKEFDDWLKEKHIVVIGRGETAGKPIAEYLHRFFATSSIDVATKSNGFATVDTKRRDNQDCAISLIHSQTPNPTDIMKQADIIISCVGKERVVPASAVKSGAILISVGIWRNAEGKLRGDYEESEIADSASWYTPTPGGVGPVNVACLMQNLVKACMIKIGGTL